MLHDEVSGKKRASNFQYGGQRKAIHGSGEKADGTGQ